MESRRKCGIVDEPSALEIFSVSTQGTASLWNARMEVLPVPGCLTFCGFKQEPWSYLDIFG